MGPEVADVDDYVVRLFMDQRNRFSRDTEFVIVEVNLGEREEDDSPGGSE
jgi:hypothetical protein